MLSPNQIDRLIAAEHYSHLIRRILDNGRCCGPATERLLTHPEARPICGLGLALQRLAELAYCRSACADRVAARLLALQSHDGLFGLSLRRNLVVSIASTAVAIRGLECWRDLQPLSNTALDRAVSRAIERGASAIAHCGSQALRNDGHQALGWVVVLWQLGDSPALRAAAQMQQLRELVAAHPDPKELSQLALGIAA